MFDLETRPQYEDKSVAYATRYPNGEQNCENTEYVAIRMVYLHILYTTQEKSNRQIRNWQGKQTDETGSRTAGEGAVSI